MTYTNLILILFIFPINLETHWKKYFKMSTLDNFSVVINITTVSDPQKMKKRNEKTDKQSFYLQPMEYKI